MHFDLQTLAPRDRYKLLVSVIVPRPIALITSLNRAGQINAAPFSFFNMLGNDPPIIAVAPGDRNRDEPKDTALNIRDLGEFVVNLVDESIAAAMNICATDFPSEINELEASGLTSIPSIAVRPPRIAQSPVSLECRRHTTLEIGRNRIILAEVLHLHIRDELVDLEKLHVHTHQLRAIGRMHGGGWYTRTTDLFEMPRPSYEEWKARQADE